MRALTWVLRRSVLRCGSYGATRADTQLEVHEGQSSKEAFDEIAFFFDRHSGR